MNIQTNNLKIISLPPMVSGKIQWILNWKLSTFNLLNNTIPDQITIQWWGNNSKDTLLATKSFQGASHSIQYYIRCSLLKFIQYLADFNSVILEFKTGNRLIGTCSFNDFQVFKNPPIQRSILQIMKNKKVVGTVNLELKLSTPQSNIPTRKKTKDKIHNDSIDKETPKTSNDIAIDGPSSSIPTNKVNFTDNQSQRSPTKHEKLELLNKINLTSPRSPKKKNINFDDTESVRCGPLFASQPEFTEDSGFPNHSMDKSLRNELELEYEEMTNDTDAFMERLNRTLDGSQHHTYQHNISTVSDDLPRSPLRPQYITIDDTEDAVFNSPKSVFSNNFQYFQSSSDPSHLDPVPRQYDIQMNGSLTHLNGYPGTKKETTEILNKSSRIEKNQSENSEHVPSEDDKVLDMLEKRARRLQQEMAKSVGINGSTTIDISPQMNLPKSIQSSLSDISDSQLDSTDALPDLEDLQMLQILNSKEGKEYLNQKHDLDQELVNMEIQSELDKLSVHNHDNGNDTTQNATDFKAKPTFLLRDAVLTRLRNIIGMKLNFKSLEITEECQCPTTIWIEYYVPTNLEEPIERFRYKVTIPLKTPKLMELKQQHVKSLSFDDETILKWQDDDLLIKIIGFGKKKLTNTKSNDRNELWSASGVIKTKDIFISRSLSWTGEIMMVKTDLFRNQKSSTGQTYKPWNIYGYLKLTVELFNDESSNSSHELIPPAIDHPTPLEQLPIYFYLQLNQIRSIQFHDNEPIMLNISCRLFKLDNLLKSIPIKYIPEFNHTTGKLNNIPMNFNFLHTTPVSMNGNFGKFPIIIEVIEIRNFGSVEQKEKLVGLIKLPFQQLAQVWNEKSNGNVGEHYQFVHLPQTEYVVVDPFSGMIRGWVQCTMALGTWSQLNQFQKNQIKENEPVAKPIEVLRDTELDDQLKEPVDAIEKEDTNQLESIIQITIHRACGLGGLLEAFMETVSDDGLLLALDYASDTGINSYVTFDLFPSEEDADASDTIQTQIVAHSFTPEFDYSIELTIQSLDSDLILWMKNGGHATAKIWHRIPKHLVSNHKDSVCISSFSISLSNLLQYRDGINHQWYFSETSQRGALQCSLTFKNGFDLGGIPSSVSSFKQFQKLCMNLNVGTISLHYSNVPENSKLYLKWKVMDSPDGGLKTYQSDLIPLALLNDENDHQMLMNYSKKAVMYVSSNLEATLIELEYWVRTPLNRELYLGSNYIDLTRLISCARIQSRQSISSKLKRVNSKLDHSKPILDQRFPIVDKDSPDLGNAFSQIHIEIEMIREKRQVLRKPIDLIDNFDDSYHTVESLENNPFVDTDVNSVSLKTRKKNSYETNARSTSPIQSNCIPKKGFSEIQNGQHFDKPTSRELKSVRSSPARNKPINDDIKINEDRQHSFIPFHITVEKAMNLPLVKDPLASSMQSPFVKDNEFTTTPPNSIVTFSALSSFKESGRVFQTSVVRAQKNPNWCYQITFNCLKSVHNIEMLKNQFFNFNVYHQNEYETILSNPAFNSDQKEMIGSCQVELLPLFSGLNEINGWYPIKDALGTVKGQLLVRITPVEDLSKVIHDGMEINNSHSLKSKSILKCKSKRAMVKSTPPNLSDNADTWVWTGQAWEHRTVTSALRTTSPDKKIIDSISSTMSQLDQLKSTMMNRLNEIETKSNQINRKDNSSRKIDDVGKNHDKLSLNDLIRNPTPEFSQNSHLIDKYGDRSHTTSSFFNDEPLQGNGEQNNTNSERFYHDSKFGASGTGINKRTNNVNDNNFSPKYNANRSRSVSPVRQTEKSPKSTAFSPSQSDTSEVKDNYRMNSSARLHTSTEVEARQWVSHGKNVEPMTESFNPTTKKVSDQFSDPNKSFILDDNDKTKNTQYKNSSDLYSKSSLGLMNQSPIANHDMLLEEVDDEILNITEGLRLQELKLANQFRQSASLIPDVRSRSISPVDYVDSVTATNRLLKSTSPKPAVVKPSFSTGKSLKNSFSWNSEPDDFKPDDGNNISTLNNDNLPPSPTRLVNEKELSKSNRLHSPDRLWKKDASSFNSSTHTVSRLERSMTPTNSQNESNSGASIAKGYKFNAEDFSPRTNLQDLPDIHRPSSSHSHRSHNSTRSSPLPRTNDIGAHSISSYSPKSVSVKEDGRNSPIRVSNEEFSPIEKSIGTNEDGRSSPSRNRMSSPIPNFTSIKDSGRISPDRISNQESSKPTFIKDDGRISPDRVSKEESSPISKSKAIREDGRSSPSRVSNRESSPIQKPTTIEENSRNSPDRVSNRESSSSPKPLNLKTGSRDSPTFVSTNRLELNTHHSEFHSGVFQSSLVIENDEFKRIAQKGKQRGVSKDREEMSPVLQPLIDEKLIKSLDEDFENLRFNANKQMESSTSTPKEIDHSLRWKRLDTKVDEIGKPPLLPNQSQNYSIDPNSTGNVLKKRTVDLSVYNTDRIKKVFQTDF
ncbi:hypothetical protein BC833DRAFT_621116 [Globomyces pollinis-pini]|nr:hypothetical protein BC833DRAFT_621116 [Globomyces pollinis-pini]